MKKIFLLMFMTATTISAVAQKAKKQNKVASAAVEAPQDNPEERQARVAMAEHSMISPMHQLMLQWGGHWREEMKIWTSPNNPPTVTHIDKDTRVFAEGKFLSSMIVGQLFNRPYEAQSVLGFDNAKKVFVKTWLDNLGTSILVLEGTYDDKNHTIDFIGFTTDPISKKQVKVHQILTITDPNNHVLEVFVEMKEGKEFKTMEIKSTRG